MPEGGRVNYMNIPRRFVPSCRFAPCGCYSCRWCVTELPAHYEYDCIRICSYGEEATTMLQTRCNRTIFQKAQQYLRSWYLSVRSFICCSRKTDRRVPRSSWGVYIYIYITHTHAHTCVCLYIYIYTHTCTYMYCYFFMWLCPSSPPSLQAFSQPHPSIFHSIHP